jgi:hypothetical protein
VLRVTSEVASWIRARSPARTVRRSEGRRSMISSARWRSTSASTGTRARASCGRSSSTRRDSQDGRRPPEDGSPSGHFVPHHGRACCQAGSPRLGSSAGGVIVVASVSRHLVQIMPYRRTRWLPRVVAAQFVAVEAISTVRDRAGGIHAGSGRAEASPPRARSGSSPGASAPCSAHLGLSRTRRSCGAHGAGLAARIGRCASARSCRASIEVAAVRAPCHRRNREPLFAGWRPSLRGARGARRRFARDRAGLLPCRSCSGAHLV